MRMRCRQTGGHGLRQEATRSGGKCTWPRQRLAADTTHSPITCIGAVVRRRRPLCAAHCVQLCLRLQLSVCLAVCMSACLSCMDLPVSLSSPPPAPLYRARRTRASRHARARTHTFLQAHTLAVTHTHTHTHTHVQAHTHVQSHTHILIRVLRALRCCAGLARCCAGVRARVRSGLF